jgi:ABC-type dipeptide/oligopeptide/nickel transport system permease subunit
LGGRSRRVFDHLRHDRAAVLAGGFVCALIVLALLAPVLAPYDPLATDFDHLREPPSRQHWLGTDKEGRDILSRLLFGARISLAVGFLSQAPILLIGTVAGCIAGYAGGWSDTFLMRLVDVFYAFPALLFLITLMAVIGRSFGSLLLALTITSWAGVARLVRGQVLQVKGADFVVAARCIGASDRQIVLHHILPNLTGTLAIGLSFGIPAAIIAEAGLSFLGLGLLPPAPSWGLMLSDGFAVLRSSPHIVLAPAAFIMATMAAFFILGDAIRDAVDPRLAG